MNRKIYTGEINKMYNNKRLKWIGKQYDYLSKCNKTFKSQKELREHEFDCEKCNQIFYKS